MLQAFINFDTARETTDGHGWHLVWVDDADPVQVQTPNAAWYTSLSTPATKRITVSNKALTTNVVTLTTSATHGLVIGQQVHVVIGDPVFDGYYIVASVPTGSTFTYARTNANVSSAAVAAPAYIEIAVLATHTATVSNKALTSNVVTLTTTYPHGMIVGESVTVALGDVVFDGDYVLNGVGSSTTLSYAKTNANVTSAAASGTVSTRISLFDKLRAIYLVDPTLVAYYTASAQAAVLAANNAAVLSAQAASLQAEGLATP